jgi:hypothetical protein
MLKVWGRNTSSNVQKVVWGLAEMAIPFERIDAGGAFGKTTEPFCAIWRPSTRPACWSRPTSRSAPGRRCGWTGS